MIAAQDHDVVRLMAANDVDILVDGIDRTLVPAFFQCSLLGRDYLDKFADLVA